MSTAEFFDEVHRRYGDPVVFVQSLRERMKAAGIKRRVLASRSGHTPPELARWLNYTGVPNKSNRPPSMWVMVLLDEALERLLAERAMMRAEMARVGLEDIR